MGLTARDGVDLSGHIRVRVYVADALRWAALRNGVDWATASDAAKLDIASTVDPVDEHSTSNLTLATFHRHLADVFDPNRNVPSYSMGYLAVGNDDTTPTVEDGGLLSEVDRVEVTTTDDEGAALYTNTLLDTAVANGYTLTEVGLASHASQSQGITFNRALIPATPKTADETITVEATITYA